MGTIIAKEVKTLSQDTSLGGTLLNVASRVSTAMINSGTPLHKIKVIELHIEYEAEETQAIVIEFSRSGDAGWNLYAQMTLAPTEVPTTVSCRRTVIHHNIQFRVRSSTLGKTRILALIPYVVLEHKENP